MPPRPSRRWAYGYSPMVPELASCPPFSYGYNPDSDPFDDFHGEGGNVFGMHGIPQAKASELRRILFDPSTGMDPTVKWFTTQLHLYGVSFKKSWRKADLEAALMAAVSAGECEVLAPTVAAVCDRLRGEYDAAVERLEDEMFAKIEGGHAEEGNVDPPRFVAKYFLDAQGHPDREKTKIPLSFRSWNNKEELDKVVKSVPGLAILKTWSTVLVGWATAMEKGIEAEFSRLETFFSHKYDIHSAQANVDLKLFLRKYLSLNPDGSVIDTGVRPSDPVVLAPFRLQNQELAQDIVAKSPGLHIKKHNGTAVIGWDKDKVDAEIAHMIEVEKQDKEKQEADKKAKFEKEEAERKARWDRRCKGYYELLAKQQGRPGLVDLQQLPGSYVVRWHGETGEDYNDPHYDGHVMKINILHPKSPHGVKASFYFGQFEGVMLLAMSKEAIAQLRAAQPKDYYDEDEEDQNDGPSSIIGHNTKLIRVERSSTGEKRSLGDISDPYGVQAARAKRQRIDPPSQEALHPSRVYFQFACSEVEGYPIVDNRNKHVGHLDFDSTGLAAKGVFYLPDLFRSEGQHIEIFKIAEQPDRNASPEPWYRYDGRQWGGW
ncbi:uncharacterized protein B0H64DRAFT_474286 [Chaetomium fimeti]|uniref:Uncharacterized protein n=1 Tax=Chaetomium fimeti TaxID=1854472 RepID=A0AAE0LRZ3_9PEZI|nr:hypothetical protein B0H64DRAFT_474286 [Chaetomium fimeti]